ncbi:MULTISPECIES: nitroreductase family protein [unclassified Variovorax]|uniref:nitroreductase family protein n=1 Tax=unclassified Variovorax TaxID=663243 RepID=UPI000D121DAB|nr:MULTISPECIES: nitroreductase family protein [unclassified Variovorax]AVQ85615.1 nitroreductase [Variovorax sp. PMC12]QRY35242.1 SagB/ThcOx family dehydrogenase [Variovorax sp. PDNC026]
MSPIHIEAAVESTPLPTPTPASMPLDKALQRRRSTREFLPDTFSLQALSSLLWAAFGVNREQQGGRTAPSAHDWKEIDVYAVLAAGAYRYEARTHRLYLVKRADMRALTGLQDFVATAPVNLVYVADFDRMAEVNERDRPFLAGADAGCIAQNVYLHCAAAGLVTVVRASIDRRALAQGLGLRTTQRITLAQTVGYPKP